MEMITSWHREGRLEGRQEGRQEGWQQGRQEGKEDLVGRLKAAGSFPIEWRGSVTSMSERLKSATPIFHAKDLEKTMSYYRDVLDFTIAWVHGSYGCVERDGVELHVFGSFNDTDRARVEQPESKASDLYIFVADVDSLYAEFKERGADCYAEPKDYPYGMRDFMVRDLNGYVLTFGQISAASSHS